MFNHASLTSLIILFVNTLVSQGASPYAPSAIGTSQTGANSSNIGQYSYDSASNRLANTANGRNQTIYMGLLTKPIRIQQGNADPELFHYGVGGKRYLRVHQDGRKTFYINGMEYRLWGDDPESIVQIRAKGYSPDIQVDVTNAAYPEYTYLLKDHLGSPVRTINNSGEAFGHERFDPWGQKVEATGKATTLSKTDESIRSYTGHELIFPAELHHMNGRVHDFNTGLFLGPDKFIQGKLISALNRFALGQNRNPNVTDESGWWFGDCLGCGKRGTGAITDTAAHARTLENPNPRLHQQATTGHSDSDRLSLSSGDSQLSVASIQDRSVMSTVFTEFANEQAASSTSSGSVMSTVFSEFVKQETAATTIQRHVRLRMRHRNQAATTIQRAFREHSRWRDFTADLELDMIAFHLQLFRYNREAHTADLQSLGGHENVLAAIVEFTLSERLQFENIPNLDIRIRVMREHERILKGTSQRRTRHLDMPDMRVLPLDLVEPGPDWVEPDTGGLNLNFR